MSEVTLSNTQVENLARPLVGILTEFYKDPRNEEEFQIWLQQQNGKSTGSSSQE